MNNKLLPIWIVTGLILINCALYINGAPGCLDNSKHLTERFDNKAYAPVACNCPCWKYKISDNRGECSRCGHAHDLKYDLRAYKNHTNNEKQATCKKNKLRTRSLAGLYEQFKERI